MKHFINFNDITPDELNDLLILAEDLKETDESRDPASYIERQDARHDLLKTSTRTRVSFEVGMYQLGGHALFLSSNDIQLGRGESVEDTAKVLSRYLDGIMIRTFDHKDVLDLARFGSIPIINGLPTDLMHPCQALSDLMTIKEHKGSLKGLKLAYIGDGNNVANSLLHACAKAGMHMAVASPQGYVCDPQCVSDAVEEAKNTGGSVMITSNPLEAVKNADVVYTDTWVSMGQEAEKAERISVFMPYQVDSTLMKSASPDAIFLHCLPAYRGYEVSAEVIDGPASVVFDEAENRLHAQKAILVKLLGKEQTAD